MKIFKGKKPAGFEKRPDIYETSIPIRRDDNATNRKKLNKLLALLKEPVEEKEE